MFNLLSLLLLVTLVQGAPLNANSLKTRNPCDGIDSGVGSLRQDENCDSLLKRAPTPTKVREFTISLSSLPYFIISIGASNL
jgi:hypothetical protein